MPDQLPHLSVRSPANTDQSGDPVYVKHLVPRAGPLVLPSHPRRSSTDLRVRAGTPLSASLCPSCEVAMETEDGYSV